MAFRGTSKRLGPLWWFESGELEDYRPDRVVLRIYDRAPCQSLCCLHESEMNHGILQRFAGEERERERERQRGSFTHRSQQLRPWRLGGLRPLCALARAFCLALPPTPWDSKVIFFFRFFFYLCGYRIDRI